MNPNCLLNRSSVEFGIALHSLFENAPQRSAKLSGRPILMLAGRHFMICLGLGVYGHCTCLHSLHVMQEMVSGGSDAFGVTEMGVGIREVGRVSPAYSSEYSITEA
jgi:hypothetical protein